MKKIMLVLAAVAMSASVNAAAFSWKTSLSGKVYTPGDSATLLASGTAYLFDATAVTQASLVEAFAAGSLNLTTLSNLSSKGLSAGAIGSTNFSDDTAVGGTLNAYFAVMATVNDQDYLYISTVGSAIGQEGKAAQLTFSEKTASQAAAMDASSGYSTAGWYTAAVPEPTSGLLLLLGMAGLALKRKQA